MNELRKYKRNVFITSFTFWKSYFVITKAEENVIKIENSIDDGLSHHSCSTQQGTCFFI